MKKLLIYLKNYKKECILGPLFKMLEASFELMIPLVVASIIDVGIANGDKSYIIKMCAVMILLGAVGLVSSVTAQYFAAKAAVGFAAKLKSALFAHMQKLSYSELDNLGASTMITRMTSDVNQVQSGVNLVLRLFLRSPFVVFGAMAMAFTIDTIAALSFCAAIALLSAVVFGIMLVSIPLYRKVQSKLDAVLGSTRANLSGVRVIRAFAKENEEIEQFTEQNEQLARTQRFVGRISALMNPLTYIIINAAIIALMWTGAIRVNAGIITQGAVVALYNYMSQILIELIKLANLIITVTKSLACANRIADIFEEGSSLESTEEASRPKQTEYAVRFEHVSLRYKSAAQESLCDIDFSVRRGETVGIIGGTGSGKSSLVNLIPRFYDAESGTVYVDGVDVKRCDISELRKKIGIVPQKAVLFAGTIRDNIRWGKNDADDAEIMRAVETAQASDVIGSKRDGLDAKISQGGKNLSGGQRQRLTIARALVRKPEILILDDSSSALDYATDARLREALKKTDATVFIVSQRAASIRYADLIVVLEDGKIAGIGTHDYLLNGCGVYSEIYYSQFPKEVRA
ncbi:MAG: ABC transporter ATP-binding protein [Oscillospiraceae bacterium]